MTYTQKTLGKDETITSVHQPSRWSLVGPFILGAVLMPFYGLGLLVWIGYYIMLLGIWILTLVIEPLRHLQEAMVMKGIPSIQIHEH